MIVSSRRATAILATFAPFLPGQPLIQGPQRQVLLDRRIDRFHRRPPQPGAPLLGDVAVNRPFPEAYVEGITPA